MISLCLLIGFLSQTHVINYLISKAKQVIFLTCIVCSLVTFFATLRWTFKMINQLFMHFIIPTLPSVLCPQHFVETALSSMVSVAFSENSHFFISFLLLFNQFCDSMGCSPLAGFSRQEYWSGLLFPSPGSSQPWGWTHISCIHSPPDSLPLRHQGSPFFSWHILFCFPPHPCISGFCSVLSLAF